MVNRKTLTRQTKQARGIAEAKPKTCAKIPRGSLSQEQFCLFDHRAAVILAQTPEATTARHQGREHRATEVSYYNCVGPYRERTCVCMFVSVFASSELRMLTAACDRAQRTKESVNSNHFSASSFSKGCTLLSISSRISACVLCCHGQTGSLFCGTYFATVSAKSSGALVGSGT